MHQKTSKLICGAEFHKVVYFWRLFVCLPAKMAKHGKNSILLINPSKSAEIDQKYKFSHMFSIFCLINMAIFLPQKTTNCKQILLLSKTFRITSEVF